MNDNFFLPTNKREIKIRNVARRGIQTQVLSSENVMSEKGSVPTNVMCSNKMYFTQFIGYFLIRYFYPSACVSLIFWNLPLNAKKRKSMCLQGFCSSAVEIMIIYLR